MFSLRKQKRSLTFFPREKNKCTCSKLTLSILNLLGDVILKEHGPNIGKINK